MEYASRKLQKRNEKHKGIELELSSHEQQLYSLSKDISLEYLDQIAHEHNSAMLDLAEREMEDEEEEEEPELPSPLPLLHRVPESARPNQLPEFVPPPPMAGMDYSQILELPSVPPTLPALLPP